MITGIYPLDARQQAQILGATHYRSYFVDSNGYFGEEKKPFMMHFFDENDEELCYYSYDMGLLVGMTVLDKPRIWSNQFKLHTNYSEPIDFRSSCVYHKFTKEEIKKEVLV